MAKILFVDKEIRTEKLGIMYLAGVLKAGGHHVDIIQTSEDDIDKYITDHNPDFLAYSLITGDHYHALNINENLKEKYSFKSIFGGPHCTFFPEISSTHGVDYVVQGAGEGTILDIVENRLPPGVHKGNLETDINCLPIPERGFFYNKYTQFRDNPIKNIITIRDCPYNCSYCYNHLWKQFYADQKKLLFQRRSVENVLKEISSIRANFPLQKINFIDDNFVQNRSWVSEFCQAYKNHINLPFLISLRTNLVDDSLIAELHDAGLEMINFALESATPKVQKEVLNRGDFSNEKVAESIKLFQSYGIRVRMQNMIGLPLEDPLKDALATLQFNLDHQVEDSWVSIFQPYPRTKLAEYCKKKGFLTGNSVDCCAKSFFDESHINISDRDKIFRLQKWWYLIIRYSLPIELVQVLIDLPLEKEQADFLMKTRFDMSRKNFLKI